MTKLTNVQLAANQIKNHKKDYIDRSCIFLEDSAIRVRAMDHNNPFVIDDYESERVATIIEKITDFKMARVGGDGEILMNYKGENGG
jgi:hypothetical protein